MAASAKSGRARTARPVPTLDMERAFVDEGFDVVVGFDEVGRGSLAGPAMVGCAALWAGRFADVTVPHHLADSKMLTEHRREAMFEPLKAWTDAWAVGSASPQEIDEWGITYALGVAALRALEQVERSLGLGAAADGCSPVDGAPDDRAAIGDGVHGDGAPGGMVAGTARGDANAYAAPGIAGSRSRAIRVGAILDGPSDYITKALGTFDAPDVPAAPVVRTRVKGDQHCASVAAAAVIAKVTRDRMMTALAAQHPEWDAYGWAANKGYGSAAHRAAIKELGTTPWHRLSWHLA